MSAVSLGHRSLKKVQQRESHAALSRDVSRLPAPSVRSRPGRLDAIVVPASRPASCLKPVIELSARLGVLLVVLCSKQTRVEQVAERVSASPGARALVVDIPESLDAILNLLLERPMKCLKSRTPTDRAT